MIIEQFILQYTDQKGREFLSFLWDNAMIFEVTFLLDKVVFRVTASPEEIKMCLARHDELLFG